jgi:hypothetical protein
MTDLLPKCLAAALLFVLTGCGTSIKGLLEEESALVWQSEPVVAAAEAEGRGREEALYDTETARHQACEKITEAVRQKRDEGGGSFGQRFWSDFRQLSALLVPIPSVERCAEAQDLYKDELAALCHSLAEEDPDLECPG